MQNIKIQLTISVRERLVDDSKDAARKLVLVRGHFRVINGRTVYVKAHYRKR